MSTFNLSFTQNFHVKERLVINKRLLADDETSSVDHNIQNSPHIWKQQRNSYRRARSVGHESGFMSSSSILSLSPSLIADSVKTGKLILKK